MSLCSESALRLINTKNSAGGNTVAYYHHDHLGTPIQATDRSGIIVWSAQYNAFGKVSITTPTATDDKPVIESKLRFPGQVEDAETGLYYNWHRYYDPELGRYVTADPIGLEGGVNLYSYVGGNPVNAVDPTGLIRWKGEAWAIALIPGFGGGAFLFDLKSKCINGRYAYITVKAKGFGAGFGAKLTGGASGVSFEDWESDIYPYGFEGTFRAFGANAGVLLTGGWTWYQLGNNFSENFSNMISEPSPGIGFDASIMGIKGTSKVTRVEWKNCGCE